MAWLAVHGEHGAWRNLTAGAERCDLRTHAGVDNELAATTFGNGNVQVQCKMFVVSLDVRTAFDVAQPKGRAEDLECPFACTD